MAVRGEAVAIFTFERYEKKYLINASQQERLIGRLINERGMVYDKYNEGGKVYGIYNIYFDDDENSLINASLMRPKFKQKLRIRGYSFPETGEETVFLELKRKIDGIVTKRRVILPYNAALAFVRDGVAPETTSYSVGRMFEEFRYFLGLKKVTPKVFISYERIALTDKLGSRITRSSDYSDLVLFFHSSFLSLGYTVQLLPFARQRIFRQIVRGLLANRCDRSNTGVFRKVLALC